MDNKEILAIVGARQTGKTTLAKHILKNRKNVKIVTFDDFKAKKLFEEDIDSFIQLYVKDYDYLFIDEIQYSENSGQKLKYIYDTQKIKILISGSSSSGVSINSLKYLVGRIFVFTLYPFSFGEFLAYKNPKLLELKNYGDQIQKEYNELTKEFITFGGYPRVVLSKNNDEKEIVLNNLYNTFLLREMKEIFLLKDSNKIVDLLKVLALQTGNIINYNELSNAVGISFHQLKDYINILEQSFVIKLCRSFHTNKRTEIVKAKKVYFLDYGFRNICLNNFNIQEFSFLYENLVFSELLKKGIELKYWRTKSKAEVDFIMQDKIPIEIKSTAKTTKSFYSFIEKYMPEDAYILSPESKKTQVEKTKIHFLSFNQFILGDMK
ncbi:MAG: ATP-binding protein [Candidatus Muiribacteriota bacterium]